LQFAWSFSAVHPAIMLVPEHALSLMACLSLPAGAGAPLPRALSFLLEKTPGADAIQTFGSTAVFPSCDEASQG
jgi:hypothetical protein